MDLKEHEGRVFFTKHGIAVPRGFLIRRAAKRDDLVQAETMMKAFLHGAPDVKRFALKAQLLSGKRGMGGGIIFTDVKNFRKDLEKLQGRTVNGEKVKEVLAVEALEVAKEFYLSVTADRNAGLPVVIMSDAGGVDIEETASKNPGTIIKVKAVAPDMFPEEEVRKAARKMTARKKGISDFDVAEKITDAAKRLFAMFVSEDCLLAEINPLILTRGNGLYAADAKITIDDNSLYRHPKNSRFVKRGHSALESAAAQYGLAYVELDGDVAVIGNGAGLVMATLDAVKHYGSEPANFCDLGGGASEMMVEKALEIVLRKRSVKKVFINIFGGITRCDEVARGIARFMKTQKKRLPPTVVRLVGTNEEAGVKILRKSGIKAFTSFGDAVRSIKQ
jgi:succinyl-CoA synthetase beta subunit